MACYHNNADLKPANLRTLEVVSSYHQKLKKLDILSAALDVVGDINVDLLWAPS
jgi:hypothetical protein